ncbi:MAG: hypothetical protein R6X10_06075 [Desulfobacterales bacterium]
MIGILGSYSTLYLWAAMVLTFFLFCVPILFFPLKWARPIIPAEALKKSLQEGSDTIQITFWLICKNI